MNAVCFSARYFAAGFALNKIGDLTPEQLIFDEGG